MVCTSVKMHAGCPLLERDSTFITSVMLCLRGLCTTLMVLSSIPFSSYSKIRFGSSPSMSNMKNTWLVALQTAITGRSFGLFKFLLVVPASSATAERSFSTLRRLKNYLRATMAQERLNHVAVLHVHKTRVDDLDVNKLKQLFISANDYRRSVFGQTS
jgi:hypothetical protein